MKKIIYLLSTILMYSMADAQVISVTNGAQFTVGSGTSVSVPGGVTIDGTSTLSDSGTLSLTGNWSNSGTVNIGTGLVLLNGSSLQTVSGTTQFNTLQLDNSAGAALQSSANVSIYTALNLQDGNMDATNGSLTFLSTSVTQCAIINNFSAGFSGTLSGTVHAQRYYNSSLTLYQHFMGSPVNTPPVSQLGASGTPGYIIPLPDCDETVSASNSPYGTVFAYDETHNTGCGISEWNVITSGNIPNGVGYSVLKIGAGTLTLSGTANLNDNYTLSGLTNSNWSNTTLQGRTITSGWHLVANPYLATLSISSGTAASNLAAGFDNQIHVWNSDGPFAGTYQFSTVLPPFQAFMVHKTNPGGSATYTINATDRVIMDSSFYRQANESELNITATNTSTGLLDKTTVAFNTNATAHFDPEYDANKLAGALSRHSLYTMDDNEWMEINVLHSIIETGAVAVGFEPGVSGNYVFSFDGINSFDPTTYVLLEDKQLGQLYNIRSGDYNFTSDATDDWNRFVLHFTPPAEILTADATCATTGMISITQPGSAVWNYIVTDTNNTTIASGILDQSTPANLSVNGGVYTLTLTDNTGYAVVKNIEVNGSQPVTASFVPSARTAPVSETINFVSSSNAEGYSWDFGDGSTATGASVSHNYSAEGAYIIQLTLNGASSCTASTSQVITITPRSATGISNVTGSGLIKIWSNVNRVYVDFTEESEVGAEIQIYGVIGQLLSAEKFGKSTVYSKEIDNIEAGYLVIKVVNGGDVIAQKVFITNIK